jgi:hypothetical protein
MPTTTLLFQNFDGETSGAAPSGWAPSSLAAGYIHTPGLSGSSKCLKMMCNGSSLSWGTYTKGFPTVSGNIDFSFVLKFPSGYAGQSYNTAVIILGSTVAELGGYGPAPVRFSAAQSSGSIIAYAAYASGGAALFMDLPAPSIGVDYPVSFSVNNTTGLFTVTASGVSYTNGGLGYQKGGSGNITSAAISQGGFTGLGAASGMYYIDNFSVIDSSFYPTSVYVEPKTPNGDNGWYITRPSVYAVSLSGGTETLYKCVGTGNSPSGYAGVDSESVPTGTPISFYTSGEVDTWKSASGAYLYYGNSPQFYNMSKIPIKWTDDVPSIGSLSFLNTSGAVVYSSNVPKSGYIKIDNLRGHTHDMTASGGQEHIGMSYLDIYTDGSQTIRVSVLSGAAPMSVSPSGVVSYYNRQSIETKTIPFELFTSGTIAPVLDHHYWSIKIPYIESDIDIESGDVYATVTSCAGAESKTSRKSYNFSLSKPSVDQAIVKSSQYSSGYALYGHYKNGASIDRVEYSLDRRVPVLHVTVSGGSLSTSDGEPPASYPYSSGIVSVSSHALEPTAADKAVYVSGPAGGRWEYPNTNFPINTGTFETYFKPVWVPTSGEYEEISQTFTDGSYASYEVAQTFYVPVSGTITGLSFYVAVDYSYLGEGHTQSVNLYSVSPQSSVGTPNVSLASSSIFTSGVGWYKAPFNYEVAPGYYALYLDINNAYSPGIGTSSLDVYSSGMAHVHVASWSEPLYKDLGFKVHMLNTASVGISDTTWSTSGGIRTIFDFSRKSPGYSLADRMHGYLFANNTTSAAALCFDVYDTFGTKYSCAYSGVPAYSSLFATGYAGFKKLRFDWDLNKPNASRISVWYGSGAVVPSAISSGRTIVFGLGDAIDLSPAAVSGTTPTSSGFSNLCIGDLASGGTGVCAGKGYFNDIRITDSIRFDSDYYGQDRFSGWQSYGVMLSSGASTFSIPNLPESTSGVEVMRLRAVDYTGNTIRSSFFNTSSCKPVLLRKTYAGVCLPDAVVYRFRLVDSQGKYPDMTFEVNPGSYSFGTDKRISEEMTIRGSRAISMSPKAPDFCSFDFENVSYVFMREFKTRADSGNSFFLVDHNDVVYYGKLLLALCDEIVSTQPSRYKVGIEFKGQGGEYDYRMD